MRRSYAGNAKPAVLTEVLNGSTAALVIECDDLTNYPTGSAGPFYVVVDRGQVTEEKILCESRVGNVLNVYNTGLVNGRGADQTTVVPHQIGSELEHIFTATDADEANAHVNNPDIHGSGATGGGSNKVFFENDLIISEDYTVTTSKNAGTFGPISIDSGATVTIPSGSVWSVV
jgi:hypothetical protein